MRSSRPSWPTCRRSEICESLRAPQVEFARDASTFRRGLHQHGNEFPVIGWVERQRDARPPGAIRDALCVLRRTHSAVQANYDPGLRNGCARLGEHEIELQVAGG